MTENGSPHSDARIQRTRQKLREFLAQECRVADGSIVPIQSDGTVKLLVLDFLHAIILAEFRIFDRFPPPEKPGYVSPDTRVATHSRTYLVTPADNEEGFQVLRLADQGTVLIPDLELEARGWQRLLPEVIHTQNVPLPGIHVEDQRPLILLKSLSLKSWVWIGGFVVSALIISFKTGEGRGAQGAKTSVDSASQALRQSRDSIGKLIRQIPSAQRPGTSHIGKGQDRGGGASGASESRSEDSIHLR